MTSLEPLLQSERIKQQAFEEGRMTQAAQQDKERVRREIATAAMQGCLAYSYCCPSRGNWQENSTDADLAERCVKYADAPLEELAK